MSGWEQGLGLACALFLLLSLLNLAAALRANHIRARAGMNGLRRLTTHQDVRRALLSFLGLLAATGAMVVALGSPPTIREAITYSQAVYSVAVLVLALKSFLNIVFDAYERLRQKFYSDSYLEQERGTDNA